MYDVGTFIILCYSVHSVTNAPTFRTSILLLLVYNDVFSSALTHMSLLGRSTQLLHSNLHIGLGFFLFPLTSHSPSLPTFIVQVFPSLACLLLYGWSAVDHMDTPLHFHILLAFLKGFNEKLPIISPDQACLEKESSKWMYHSSLKVQFFHWSQ